MCRSLTIAFLLKFYSKIGEFEVFLFTNGFLFMQATGGTTLIILKQMGEINMCSVEQFEAEKVSVWIFFHVGYSVHNTSQATPPYRMWR